MISRYANAYINGYLPLIPSLDGGDAYGYFDSPYNSAVLVFKATDIKVEPHIQMEGFYRLSLEGDIIARPAFSDRFTKIDKIRLTCNGADEKELEEIKTDYEIGKTYIVSFSDNYCDIDRRAKQEIIYMYISTSHGAPTGATVDNVDWSKLEIGSDKKPTKRVVGEQVDATIECYGQVYGISGKYLDGLGYCGSDGFRFPRGDDDSNDLFANYYGSIAEVTGTLEDFLADPENKSWVDSINEINRSLSAATVYGTDNINSILLFADKTMYLSDGEEFSAEDYEQGNNVCIVSETAAYKNGWKLGDKITLNYYDGVQVNYQNFTKALPGEYTSENDLGISCEYEIKGIYRHTNSFSGDPSDITPNTVFVPNKSLDNLGIRQNSDPADESGFALPTQSDMDFESMVIKNGRIDDMKAFIE